MAMGYQCESRNWLCKRFADHHRFTQQEILNAINRGKKRQAELIITTQKDAAP